MKLTRLFTAVSLGLILTTALLWSLRPAAAPPALAAPLADSLPVGCTNGVGDTADLIDQINIANSTATADTLILGPGCVYTLSQAYQIGGVTEITSTFGKAGLPAITTTIVISGHGATIQRALTATNDFTGSFRLLTVGPGGDLTLHNLTLRNGRAEGGFSSLGSGGAAGMGGAIFNNRGRLVLNGVTLLDNVAQGGNGSSSNSFSGVGGGGGVGSPNNNGDGGGPNGGSSADSGIDAGPGGFGGGGGGGPGSSGTAGSGGLGGGGGGGVGGDGGFGGGGGGADDPSSGGFGGGDGSGGYSGGGAAGMGGAIFNLTGTLRITNSTFFNNAAQGGNGFQGGGGFGGAIFNLNGPATLLNSTIAGNSVASGSGGTPVTSAGGGLYSLGDGGLDETGDPADNSLIAAATLAMSNTIVANSSGGNDCVVGTYQSGTSNTTGTNNLAESNAGCAGVTVTGDPQLGPLQDNGGDTWTMALLGGSPAIDAGDNAAAASLATDQAGQLRKFDNFQVADTGSGTPPIVDMGAFENQDLATYHFGY